MRHTIGKSIIHRYTGKLGSPRAFRRHVCFYHKDKRIMVVIHGDDFTALGHSKDLDWCREMIQQRMSTKVKGRLGPEDTDLKQMRVLNRIVEWTDNGIRYEADQRHA